MRKPYYELFSVGFHCPAWLWLGGTPPRDYLRDIREFERPEHARRNPASRDPHLHHGAHAGLLRVPRPRAREQTRGRKRKSWPMCKKSPLGTSTYHFFAPLGVAVQVASADKIKWRDHSYYDERTPPTETLPPNKLHTWLGIQEFLPLYQYSYSGGGFGRGSGARTMRVFAEAQDGDDVRVADWRGGGHFNRDQ